jgi:hypothetical protein
VCEASMAIPPKLKLAAAPSRQGLKRLQQGANQLCLWPVSPFIRSPNPVAVESQKSFQDLSLSIESPEFTLSLWPSSIGAQSSASTSQLKESAPTRRETLVLPASSYWLFCCSFPKLASASTSQQVYLCASQHPHTYTTTMNRLPHEAIIDSYFRDATPKNTDDEWLFNAEIPAAQEMSRPLLSDDSCVPENQVKGNWSSKLEHLTAHYQFLREESTFALRRAIGLVREQPHLSELDHRETSPGIGIYEKVTTNQNQIL